MKKLKLKHLAPYLPYRLKVYNTLMEVDFELTISEDNTEPNTIHLEYLLTDRNEYKPILRPLSDITKEIEHNGKRFVPLQHLQININWYSLEQWKSDHKLINVEEYNNLLSWHFDVYGLIEKKLAIDINTIEK